MVVKKMESIPTGWNGMRRGMEAGVIKLYVGSGQASKLGWTSLTTLVCMKRYLHLLYPLLPHTYCLGLSLGILLWLTPHLQPSPAECPRWSSNSTLSAFCYH